MIRIHKLVRTLREKRILLRYNSGAQRGDTLIEVLLSIVVLSAVVIGTIAFMNRGHAMVLDSLERSEVTALMTEQSEMLQYIRNTYDESSAAARSVPPANLWAHSDASVTGNLMSKVTSGATAANCEVNSSPFYLKKSFDGSNKLVVSVEDFDESTRNEFSPNFVSTFARPGDGLWIEAERPASGSGGIDYVDFHIKACWRSSGNGPKAEARTVVRLYEPTAAVECSPAIHDLVITVDASSSMQRPWGGSTRMAEMKRISRDFIDNAGISPMQNNGGVAVFYSSSYIAHSLSSDVPSLQAAIDVIPDTYSGTHYLQGLNRAKAMLDGSSVRKVIIFISDGAPTESPSLIYPVTDALKASGYSIYTIGITTSSTANTILSKMAGGGNGRFVSAADPADLQAMMDSIAQDLECP